MDKKRNNPERSLFINFLRGSWPSCKLNGRFSILWKHRMKEFTDNVYSLFPILIGLWQGIVARIEEVAADYATTPIRIVKHSSENYMRFHRIAPSKVSPISKSIERPGSPGRRVA